MPDGLPDWVVPGVKFRLFGNLYHVRGLVDGHAVLRFWMPHKRRYAYVVEDWTWFWVNRTDFEGKKKPPNPKDATVEV